jgi:hypothetical protein
LCLCQEKKYAALEVALSYLGKAFIFNTTTNYRVSNVSGVRAVEFKRFPHGSGTLADLPLRVSSDTLCMKLSFEVSVHKSGRTIIHKKYKAIPVTGRGGA